MSVRTTRRGVTDAERQEAFLNGEYTVDLQQESSLEAWYLTHGAKRLENFQGNSKYDLQLAGPGTFRPPLTRQHRTLGGGVQIAEIWNANSWYKSDINLQGIVGDVGKLTLSAWVYRTQGSYAIWPFSQGSATSHLIQVLHNWNRQTQFDCKSTGVTIPTYTPPESADKWYHIVCVADTDFPAGGGQLKLYVDGVLGSSTESASNVLPTTDPPPTIIGYNHTESGSVRQAMFDLRVYSRALQAEEVRELYERPWQIAKPLTTRTSTFFIEDGGPTPPPTGTQVLTTRRGGSTDDQRINAVRIGDAEVDWMSPQAQGLVAAFPMTDSQYAVADAADETNRGVWTHGDIPVGHTVHPLYGAIRSMRPRNSSGTASVQCRVDKRIDLPLQATICAWVYKTHGGVNSRGSVFSSCRQPSGFVYAGHELSTSSFGAKILYGAGTTGTAGYRQLSATALGIGTDRWDFYVYTCHGLTDQRLYVNGVDRTGDLSLSGSATSYSGGTTEKPVIGNYMFNNQAMEGYICDLRVYARAMELEEIRDIQYHGEQLYQPKTRSTRAFTLPSGTPTPEFPTPDNFLQASPRRGDLLDFYQRTIPATIPVADTTCQANTRPTSLSVRLFDTVGRFGSVQNHYTGADWQEVAHRVNTVHWLEQVSLNLYRRTFTVDVGSAPIDVTIEGEFLTGTYDGPALRVKYSSQGAHFPDHEAWWHSPAAPPYNCGLQFIGLWVDQDGQGGWDTDEGGLDMIATDIDWQTSAAPEEPSSGKIWEYEPTVSFTKADWDAERATLGTGSEGRPSAASATWATSLPAPFGYITGGRPYGINHAGGYEIPEMDSDGWFKCQMWNPAQDQHNQIRLGTSHESTNAFYLRQSPYRFRIHIQFEVLGSIGDFDAVDWVIPIDLLKISTNPPGWTAGNPGPSVALYMRGIPDNYWGYQIAGAAAGETDFSNPSNSQNLEVFTYDASEGNHVFLGGHQLVIELEIDREGVDSYTAIYLDGRELVVNTKHNAFHVTGANAAYDSQLFPKIGAYHSTAANQVLRFGKMSIYELSTAGPPPPPGGIGTMQIGSDFIVG